MLGSSAALFGPWVEREGPRKAGIVAACCWGGSFFLSAIGIYFHQIWLLWLGSGVIGGCGLGLGYISPRLYADEVVSRPAGFTGMLSLFNIAGRIGWASLSDRIGRKVTHSLFFGLGILLYASAPTAGASGNLALFVAIFCVILMMYGGALRRFPHTSRTCSVSTMSVPSTAGS